MVESINDWCSFAVADHGIFFLTASADHADHTDIRFFSFGTEEIKKVFSTTKYANCPAISPDGRSLLYSQLDREDSDLMLVENFR